MTYDNRWEVSESLGEGGQAHTFLVHDKRGGSDTPYVLKRLKNITRIDRFKREIEATRNMTHENIVRLVDFNLDHDKPYLVTEYCAGGSLAKAKPIWKDSPPIALRLFQQICNGVAYAHTQGVIHRDLKPDNIFLRTDAGPAVVGDFGICFLDDEGSRVTLTEEAVGARHYMAPELEDGRVSAISSKSDTYSLGKILYWLLSGGKEFSREKHRDRQFDLKRYNVDSEVGWDNIYMEHVNRLLDLMITHNPEDRRDVGQISVFLKRIVRRVEKEFTPISPDIQQPCTYCGYGNYSVVARDNTSTRNFGFVPVGDPNWRILVCDMCGHVQAFRVDYAREKNWWK
jgi:serine/threonine protein kinase